MTYLNQLDQVSRSLRFETIQITFKSTEQVENDVTVGSLLVSLGLVVTLVWFIGIVALILKRVSCF